MGEIICQSLLKKSELSSLTGKAESLHKYLVERSSVNPLLLFNLQICVSKNKTIKYDCKIMEVVIMQKQSCYIYTRVSTAMQVEGFSLDAQKEKLRKYAKFQDLFIAGEYTDEGKSGKNIEGRPEFQRMLEDIESGKDKISYVLVFKLSRFGRNAADSLNALQCMEDYGVNLICVEEGIDSSKDSGKLMISVLSAVAEIERENILVQTMEGRKQKAREGKWNGGFAPYGYKLENGELKIA